MSSSIVQHVRRVERSIAAGDGVRSALVASWHRCISLHGLSPAEEPAPSIASSSTLSAACEKSGSIVSNGAAAMERLWSLVRGYGACLMFAGTEGIVVRVWNHLADDLELAGKGLRIGADWSEQAGGTNGIGTCIVEEQVRSIHLDQHFYTRDASISCVAAPVFDHRGALAGALNLTIYGASARQIPPGLLTAPVAEAARQIEADHFRASFPTDHGRARIVALAGHPRLGAALVAVDRDGVLLGANRAARQLHGLIDASIARGISLDMLEDCLEEGFPEAERGALRRALLANKGNVTAAALSLGISRATIKRKLRDHGLSRRRSSAN